MCRDCDYLYSVRDGDMRWYMAIKPIVKSEKLETRKKQWRYMANFNWFMRRSSLPLISYISGSIKRWFCVHNIKADKNKWMEYLAIFLGDKDGW